MKTAIIIIIIAVILFLANARDTAQNALADCIIEKATADHYPSPYSSTAWTTYSPLCASK